jgi:Kinesin motor domain
LNDREKKHGTLPVVSASTNDKTVTVIKGSGNRQAKTSYKFDNVFTAFSSQEEVFEATLQPVIRDVLMGFESTVFAYGQTGTFMFPLHPHNRTNVFVLTVNTLRFSPGQARERPILWREISATLICMESFLGRQPLYFKRWSILITSKTVYAFHFWKFTMKICVIY